jgi:ABC-type glycerol-3-phosphate transport system substrate-binding protein
MAQVEEAGAISATLLGKEEKEMTKKFGSIGQMRACALATVVVATGGTVLAQESTEVGALNEELSGTLSWVSMGSQEAVSNAVTEAYQAVRPNVEVDYAPIPGGSNDLRTGLLARQLANNPPDVFQIADRFPRQFGEAGLSGDLTDFLSDPDTIGRDYFAPTFLRQYEIQDGPLAGTIQGLPQSADVVVLYYNSEHFDEAGIEYPNADWTWDDLVDAARALTVSENGEVSRYGFGTRYAWHATYVPAIHAFGGQFLGDDGYVDLTSDAAVSAFETYFDFVDEGIFAPSAALRAQGDEATAFGNDYISMFAYPRAALPRIRSVKTESFDVAMLPMINGVRVAGMGSVGMAASPQGLSDNQELVYDFLDWYYAPDGGMAVLTANYAVVPPSTALFDSPIWRNLPAPPATTAPFVESMEFGVQNPAGIPSEGQGVIDEAIRYAEDQYFVGGVSLADALAEAEEAINREFDNMR